ncbi:MAG: MIP family channel protein [Bacillota bacterium]
MNRYLAEFVGTFVLVFTGIGSAVLAGDRIGAMGIALAFGIALLAMVYTIGPISGCHINPAVTLGLVLTRKFDVRYAGGYIVAQILGAIVAAGLVLAIAKGAPAGYNATIQGLGANGFAQHSPSGYGWGSAFLAELLLTMVLVFTVLGATDIKAPVGFAGLAIGLALALTNLVAIPITNASINPARSIGPAVFAGGWAWAQIWLFIVAPLLGACLAAGAYEAMKRSTWRLREIHALQAIERQRAERYAEQHPGLTSPHTEASEERGRAPEPGRTPSDRERQS